MKKYDQKLKDGFVQEAFLFILRVIFLYRTVRHVFMDYVMFRESIRAIEDTGGVLK